MNANTRLLAVSVAIGVLHGVPAAAECPTNILAALGILTYTSSPRANISRGAPCQFGGSTSASAAYDLVAGTFSASGQGASDCGASGASTTDDVFRLIGPASPDSIPFTARLQASAFAFSPAGFSSGANVEFREGTSNSQTFGYYPGGPSSATLSLNISRAVGDSFNLHIVVAAYAGSRASASASGTLSFIGLPPGYAVVSCQGYVSDLSVPVRATSWGRLKTIYR